MLRGHLSCSILCMTLNYIWWWGSLEMHWVHWLNCLSFLQSFFHYHHLVPLARIPLTLSRHFSLLFIASGRSSGLHSHSCWMYVPAARPAFARPYVGVHRSTLLMSSSLLLQQCPACLLRLTITESKNFWILVIEFFPLYLGINKTTRFHKSITDSSTIL